MNTDGAGFRRSELRFVGCVKRTNFSHGNQIGAFHAPYGERFLSLPIQFVEKVADRKGEPAEEITPFEGITFTEDR